MKKRWKGVFLQLWCCCWVQQLGNHVARQILTVFSVNTSYPVYYVSFVSSHIYAHTHCVFAGIRSLIQCLLKYYVSSREYYSVFRGKGLISQNLCPCSRFGTDLLHDSLKSCLTCFLLVLFHQIKHEIANDRLEWVVLFTWIYFRFKDQ